MSRLRLVALAGTAVLVVLVLLVGVLAEGSLSDVLTGVVAALALGLLADSRLVQRQALRGMRTDVARLRQRSQGVQQAAQAASRHAQAADERARKVDQGVRELTRLMREVKQMAGYRFRDRMADWHQVEALQNLYALLQPRQAVPGTRSWAASPDLLLWIVGHIFEHRPRTVLECGSGVSTLWTAYALERIGGGQVISLEHDSHYAARTRKLLARHGLSAYADVREAPLTAVQIGDQEWPWYDTVALADLPPVDLLVVDGPPAPTGPLARYPAGPVLAKYLAPDAVIVLDDAIREDERTIAERWSQELEMDVEHVKDLEKQALVLRRRTPA